MFGFCPLASGSKGNSIFLGSKNTRILIDAGLSAKALKERLQKIGVDIKEIDAILITHEHIDHIRGLETLTSTYNIPVFANSDTAKAIYDTTGCFPKFKIFSTGETFTFGDLQVHPFSIQHDTVDPVAFTIHVENQKLGFCTDLGFVTTLVSTHLKECNYLYIEANHEPSMVHASSRPNIYKQRVLGRQGHLSNRQCADLLLEIYHPKLEHIHLAHLSQECNSPELALKTAQDTIAALGGTTEISIALQETISRSITLSNSLT